MGNQLFRPKRLRYEEIWEIAEEFRKEHLADIAEIPVPIEEIVEFKLHIEIVPQISLKTSSDIEAFLSNDLKSIYVDSSIYFDDRYLQRLRFTLAHEIGHYVMHKDVIRALHFNGYEDWSEFIKNTKEEDIEWFERQAFEFAGRLMVPKEYLVNLIRPLKTEIEEYAEKLKKEAEFDMDYLLTGVARKICSHFNISADVVKIRIRKEKIFDILDINLYTS